MRVAAISDLHGQLPESCPDVDYIILAGDICPDSRPIVKQGEWLDTKFRAWLKGKPPVFATWGNHDFIGQSLGYPKDLPWTVVVDAQVALPDGREAYFTPWVPNLARWAFGTPYDVPDYYRRDIPAGLDFLVSHGPPWGFFDTVFDCPHVGSESLTRCMLQAQPKITICGHIHESRGNESTQWGGRVYNVASLDRDYKPYPERWTVIELG